MLKSALVVVLGSFSVEMCAFGFSSHLGCSESIGAPHIHGTSFASIVCREARYFSAFNTARAFGLSAYLLSLGLFKFCFGGPALSVFFRRTGLRITKVCDCVVVSCGRMHARVLVLFFITTDIGLVKTMFIL